MDPVKVCQYIGISLISFEINKVDLEVYLEGTAPSTGSMLAEKQYVIISYANFILIGQASRIYFFTYQSFDIGANK